MKSTYTYVSPPRWAPNAVPSDKGWLHPVTGEVLVAIAGGIPFIHEKEVIDETIEAKTVIDETVNDVTVLNETIAEKEIIDETVKEDKPLIDETTKSKPATKRTRSKKDTNA